MDRREFIKKSSTVGLSATALKAAPSVEAAGQINRTFRTAAQPSSSRIYQTTKIEQTYTDSHNNRTEYEFRLMTCGVGRQDIGNIWHSKGSAADIIAKQYTDIYNPSGNLGFFRGIGTNHFGIQPANGRTQAWSPDYKAAITALASSTITEIKSKAKWFLTAGKVVEALVPDEVFLSPSTKGDAGTGFQISKDHYGGFFGSHSATQCSHFQEFKVVVPDTASKEVVEIVSGLPGIHDGYDNDAGVSFQLVFGDGSPYIRNVTHMGTDW